jgi:hypothetical protein
MLWFVTMTEYHGEYEDSAGTENKRFSGLKERARQAGAILLIAAAASTLAEGSPTRRLAEKIPVLAFGFDKADELQRASEHFVAERSIQRELAGDILFYDQVPPSEPYPGPHDLPPELVEQLMEWPSQGPDMAHRAQFEQKEIQSVDPVDTINP